MKGSIFLKQACPSAAGQFAKPAGTLSRELQAWKIWSSASSLHERWAPPGQPAVILLFRTSPRQDGQQLFAVLPFQGGLRRVKIVITVTTKKEIFMNIHSCDMEMLLICLLGTRADGGCAM